MKPKPRRIKREGMKRTMVVLAVVAIGGVCGYLIYHQGNYEATTSQSKVKALSSQLSKLRSQYVSLQVARNIVTTDWKTYCNPQTLIYCYAYPNGWALNKSNGLITDPSGTVSIYLVTGDVHDGGTATFIPISVDDLSLETRTLKIVGGYYITSVGYHPLYAITEDTNGLQIGQPSLYVSPIAFDLNNRSVPGYSIFSVTYEGSDLTTQAQANAWFDSISGKTALAIVKSLHRQ